MDLIKWGWIKRDISDYIYKNRFLKISQLMRTFKSQEIENFLYVLINEYFIDNNNLYFFGNEEVYSIDLNDDFIYNCEDINLLVEDYKKIKFVCKLTLEDVIKHGLISKEFKRDKKISDLLDQ
jgi:hypothetical protein